MDRASASEERSGVRVSRVSLRLAMITRVSKKGQVVVSSRICRQLGLQPGDPLEAKIEGQQIVLTPRKARSRKARIIRDPVTRLPVLTAGPKAPKLTSAEVREILADFP